MLFKMTDGTFLYGNYARELMIKEDFNKDKLFVIHNSLAGESNQEGLRKCNIIRIIRKILPKNNIKSSAYNSARKCLTAPASTKKEESML